MGVKDTLHYTPASSPSLVDRRKSCMPLRASD
ncbi:hypothetical protein COLO4_04169 [Corchorus olitorius]|uniref:Uncharacterized protein n=1 Tax=Corchorus olitorius TaxID=93759 RepID=A0A1R3KV32_9ROSI|nr:hypothetical protein COLO4_04169 [Corchorus olitorius]